MNTVLEPCYVEQICSSLPKNWGVYRPLVNTFDESSCEIFQDKFNSNYLDGLHKCFPFLGFETIYNQNIDFSCFITKNQDNYKNYIRKELYIMSCSDIIVADISDADYGERSIIISESNNLNIPIIGVSTRFLNSPWLFSLVNTVVKPENVLDEILLYGSAIIAKKNSDKKK
jgi:energy-converting hydrogenase Eha subunit E